VAIFTPRRQYENIITTPIAIISLSHITEASGRRFLAGITFAASLYDIVFFQLAFTLFSA